MLKQTCYILVGLIGSGKSTWAKDKVLTDNALILNRDGIRTMLFGKYDYKPSVEDKVIKPMIPNFFGSCKDSGMSIIVDETNLTRDKRKNWIIQANEFGFNTHCVWFNSIEGNVDRRMNDPRGISRDVWQETFDKMLKTFEPIEDDEKALYDAYEVVEIPYKKVVCVDFDGVLNGYEGWAGEDELYLPQENAVRFLSALQEMGFKVVIHSTRDTKKIQEWLLKHGFGRLEEPILLMKEKPHAVAYIDDRAICFNGNYQEVIDKLSSFKPYWHK